MIGDLCNREDAIITSARTLNAARTRDLTNWFDQVGLHWYDVQSADLDGNGTNDWIASLEYHDQWFDGLEIWAFMRRPGNLEAVFINTFELTSSPLKWQSFHPEEGNILVDVVAKKADFTAFYITSDGKLQLVIDPGFPVTDFRIENTPHASNIIITTNSSAEGVKTTSYRWDPSILNFVDQDEFRDHEQEAERLLFLDLDFPAAIQSIEKYLAKAPPEPHILAGEVQPDWYLPHLRYLLGIAYEMNNQPDQAEAVYYQLWKDYPANIFGLAAAAKLEPSP
jgi:hypothetical protein